MGVKWRSEWPHWLVLAAMFALAAVTWPTAPARIPVHWNVSGAVDRYGGRFEGVLGLPLLALGLYLLLLVLPLLDPARASYAHFAWAYSFIRFAVLLVLATSYGVIHLWLRGWPVNVGLVVGGAVGLLLIGIGNVLGKVRPNWFVGIRTPWTLTSRRAWARTHRLGGWVSIADGMLLLVATIAGVPWVRAVSVAIIGASVLALIVYSYVVWRGDPDRGSAALPSGGQL